jgi:2-polyprenyl-3-methyl-5-hydroxy-6-metoxy-1,4-benzoquinol methylase
METGTPDSRGEIETWRFGADREAQSFELRVKCGKTLDILAFRGSNLEDHDAVTAEMAAQAAALYAGGTARRPDCPCCLTAAAARNVAATVFDVDYVTCAACGHWYVDAPPAAGVVLENFRKSDHYAGVYTDIESLEQRLRDVVQPKLDWVMEIFRDRTGREPRSIWDVGAGAGHFIEVCRRIGLTAKGYEVNEACRDFARGQFGVELIDADFLAVDPGVAPPDIITFWGLLEYLPEPDAFIGKAADFLHRSQGLLVCEVPRAECLSSTVQATLPHLVARHLDPGSHLNCFSDASIATLLLRHGMAPHHAWYFGMDAYELLSDLARSRKDRELLVSSGELLLCLQRTLDRSRCCDDLVIAASPAESKVKESSR